MRRRRSLLAEEGESEEPLINLTPLIDVVFVVLITFMLIAPVLDIDLVELAPGSASHQKEASTSPLTISVRSDNSIWFRGKPIHLDELERALKQAKLQYPEYIPQVIPDKQAHFGTFQAVKNTLELCGFSQMDVVLQPQ